MLHQELPTISARPLDGNGRWLLPSLGAAAALSLGLIWLQFGIVPTLVFGALAAGGAFAAWSALVKSPATPVLSAAPQSADFGLVGAALALCEEPAAITSTDGALL